VAKKGKARLVKARRGEAGEAVARQGKLGYARQGKTWFCKGMLDYARQIRLGLAM
jgi:hypothetical protein